MKKINNEEKGITLVALVITIIILLILAGITIAQLTGSGLFENAKLAKEKYKNAQHEEETEIDKYINDIDAYISGNRDYETEINNLNSKIQELENRTNYSTSEKVIGTWVDGKPLYQKTIITRTPSKADEATNIADIPDTLEYGTIINTTILSNTGLIDILNLNQSSSVLGRIWILTNRSSNQETRNKLRCVVGNNSAHLNQPLYVTIQYTKTTDTATN